MSLPGGAADKIGNRYEMRWTLLCIIEIMNERADSIRLEPPGTEGEGVEFCLRKGAIREYHQVKRQNSASGRWTLTDLAGEGVLKTFLDKLNDPGAWCVFVSADSAFELKDLSQRSRDASSWNEFEKEFLKDNTHSTTFSKLRNHWAGHSRENVFELLKRLRIETISEDLLITTGESLLACIPGLSKSYRTLTIT
ncbi:MAG: hypothetical protein HZB51_32525 [Chloroflexi bacterium]|nr:hypothetical protein [Chloroflexota bacterium]